MRKFWDREGKMFGIINPVDLGIIMLLAVVFWRVGMLYLPQSAKYRGVVVTLGVFIPDVPPALVKSIVVGQDLFQNETQAYLGKITAKTAVPAELVLADRGKLLLSRAPRNLDLRLTLRRTGQIRTGPARAAILLGKLAVRIGDPVKAHTLYTSVRGEVETLRFH